MGRPKAQRARPKVPGVQDPLTIAGFGVGGAAGREGTGARDVRTGGRVPRDPRPWRRTRRVSGEAGTVHASAQGQVTPSLGSVYREEAMSALEPPHMPARPSQDVRLRFKFPEEFPEGAYGSPDSTPVETANGRWHVGQRSLSSEADQFAFEIYRYDLDYDPVVGTRGDWPPKLIASERSVADKPNAGAGSDDGGRPRG